MWRAGLWRLIDVICINQPTTQRLHSRASSLPRYPLDASILFIRDIVLTATRLPVTRYWLQIHRRPADAMETLEGMRRIPWRGHQSHRGHFYLNRASFLCFIKQRSSHCGTGPGDKEPGP